MGLSPPPKLFERGIGNIGPEISFLVNPPPSPTLSALDRGRRDLNRIQTT